jgi:hypothetical protein
MPGGGGLDRAEVAFWASAISAVGRSLARFEWGGCCGVPTMRQTQSLGRGGLPGQVGWARGRALTAMNETEPALPHCLGMVGLRLRIKHYRAKAAEAEENARQAKDPDARAHRGTGSHLCYQRAGERGHRAAVLDFLNSSAVLRRAEVTLGL